MISMKPWNCPSSSGSKLLSATGDMLDDPNEYQKVIGALQ